MSAVPVVADRVMRARRESVCTLCSSVVLVGQQIARCPGGLWVHAACFIGHKHEGDLNDLKFPPAKSAKDAKESSPGMVGTLGTLPVGDEA